MCHCSGCPFVEDPDPPQNSLFSLSSWCFDDTEPSSALHVATKRLSRAVDGTAAYSDIASVGTSNKHCICATGQEFSVRLLTTESRVRFWLVPCEIYGGRNGTRTGLFPRQHHYAEAVYRYNRDENCAVLGYYRGELIYLAPLGSEKISAPYFKQCFFRGGGNTTPPSPKTEITNILFYILNFASIIKFKT